MGLCGVCQEIINQGSPVVGELCRILDTLPGEPAGVMGWHGVWGGLPCASPSSPSLWTPPPGLPGREEGPAFPRAVSPAAGLRLVLSPCLPCMGTPCHAASGGPGRAVSVAESFCLRMCFFTFSFLQQLSGLVPGFVLGGGRICGYKTRTEASFRCERGSLCAGRCFALCSKFPFEKCQIILVNTVENPPAWG